MKKIKTFKQFLNENLNESKFNDPALKKAVGQTVKKVTEEDFDLDTEMTVITFNSGKRLELFVLSDKTSHTTETYWITTHGDINKMKGKTISDFNQTNKGSKLTFIFLDGSKIKLEARTESGAAAWFSFDFN